MSQSDKTRRLFVGGPWHNEVRPDEYDAIQRYGSVVVPELVRPELFSGLPHTWPLDTEFRQTTYYLRKFAGPGACVELMVAEGYPDDEIFWLLMDRAGLEPRRVG